MSPQPELPSQLPRSQVSLTTVFTVCLGGLAVYAGVILVINGLVALTLSVSALMIAVALDHGVAFLVRRGLRRGLALGVVATAVLGIAVGVGFTVIPPALQQGKELVKRAPALFEQLKGTRLFQAIGTEAYIRDRILDFEKRLPEALEGAAGPLLSAVGSVLSGLAAVVTIFFLAIFMLIFGGRLIEALLGEALPHRRERYRVLVKKIYTLIGGYLGGLAFICSVNAMLTTAFLAIVRIDFFLPLGLLSGFSSMVPYAGPLVAGTTISLIALTGGLWKGVASAIFFVAYGQLEGNILGPLIFKRTVHVNPLIVTLSLLFFGEIAGVIGAVLAVPITAAVQILVRELLRVRRERLHLAKTAMNSPSETS